MAQLCNAVFVVVNPNPALAHLDPAHGRITTGPVAVVVTKWRVIVALVFLPITHTVAAVLDVVWYVKAFFSKLADRLVLPVLDKRA